MKESLQAVLAGDQHLGSVCAGYGGRSLGWIEIERRVSLVAGAQGEITGLVVGPAARRRGLERAWVEGAESWEGRARFRDCAVGAVVARPRSALLDCCVWCVLGARAPVRGGRVHLPPP